MRSKNEFHVSANYFTLFLIVGSYFPFITIFLYRAGWTGAQVGLFTAIGTLASLVAQPVSGYIADVLGDTKKVYSLLLFLSGTTTLLFGVIPVSLVFFSLSILSGLLQSPLNPMLDSLALVALGEKRNYLGRMRLWGSVSFALITSIMGRLFEFNERSIFLVYFLGALLAILSVRPLPSRQRGNRSREGLSVNWRHVREIANVPLFIFLGLVFLLQLGHSTTINFLSIVMENRGASMSVIGSTWSITAMVEIPIFFLSATLLNRHSPVLVLALGAFMSFVRITAFTLAPTPYLMLAAHALDGLAFPLIIIPGILVVNRLVPERFRTTGQTVYATASATLPRIMGGLIGGTLLDTMGWASLYVTSAFFSILSAVLLLWFHISFFSKDDKHEISDTAR